MATQTFKIGLSGHAFDRVWLAFFLGFFILFAFDIRQGTDSLLFTGDAIIGILPFLLASVFFAAYAKASGLDNQVARVFSGNPTRSIMMAAVFGALSPFCSCGVVPIIAGLLAAGVPLAPVIAFCIASPLMDPEMFVLMLGVFGVELTLVKTISALAIGMGAGFITHYAGRMGWMPSPLKTLPETGCCGSSSSDPLQAEKVQWAFWEETGRRQEWWQSCRTTGLFLFKWLALAFFIESLMVAYVPAEQIGAYLGGDAWWSVPLSVLIGIPAYLNGYAAIPTVKGLMDLGMSPAAALGFIVGGGVTSIPAAMAVYALVRREVFVLYLLLGIGGAMTVSFAYMGYLAV